MRIVCSSTTTHTRSTKASECGRRGDGGGDDGGGGDGGGGVCVRACVGGCEEGVRVSVCASV